MLEAFLDATSGTDPVVTQNIETGRVAVDLTVDSASTADATVEIVAISETALANLTPSVAIASMRVDAVRDRGHAAA